MKIVKLQAENIKRLRAVEITPDGSIVQITGPNGSGKSSVLDAIYYALAGQKAIDSRPVRDGAERATITLDLGEFTVARTFRADAGTTKLEVITPEGARFPSPQKMLDALLGALTFDPLAFARGAPKEQLDQLKRLVPLDIDLDDLDLENRRDFASRTDVNRTVKELEAQLKGFGDVETVEPPATVASILAELDAAMEMNRQTDIEARRRADYHQMITHAEKRRARLVEELAEIDAQVVGWKAEAGAWEPEERLVDVSALRARIDEATEAQRAYNTAQRRQTERDQLAMKLDHAKQTSEEFTVTMDRRTERRTQAIAAAQMPVDGLGFGDGEVTYNGIPFTQASGAEQLRVSVAIAMAGKPKLRVLRIKDGSLLDSKSMALLGEMAELNDFQVWVESVDESRTCGIVMEDGAVASMQS